MPKSPKSVRNFWVETEVDSESSRWKNNVGSGPRSATGGFFTGIYIRDHGKVSTSGLFISGKATQDGKLYLIAYKIHNDAVGEEVFRMATER